MDSRRDIGEGGGGMEGLCALRLMLVMKARSGRWTIGEKPKPYLVERDLSLTPFSCPLGLYWIYLRRRPVFLRQPMSVLHARLNRTSIAFYPRKASQVWKEDAARYA